MLRSLRSRLILASLLWTGGLLALMHLASLLFLHVFPRFHGAQSILPIAFGLSLMAAGVYGAWRGLKPFRLLRERLTALRRGEIRRVEGEYPSEAQPLIDDLNALLEERERAVKRALATAGDLAHGLKTPLALLSHEAARARAAGNTEWADALTQQVERMSRHVDYHLARARAAASGAAGAPPCLVAPCAEALVRTLSKLHAGKALQVTAVIGPDLLVRVQREDLDEMFGNLLDNACKWADSKAILAAAEHGSMLTLTLDDDGPGLAPALRRVVLERGVRIDEAARRSGLGLAIVRDLAELYGGAISLDESPWGGLRAILSFLSSPACGGAMRLGV